MKPNLYRILGIPRTANLKEIRTAYRALAHRFHPDKNVDIGETELFLDVQNAFEILSDPKKRAEYDKDLPEEPEEKSSIKISTIYSRTSLTRIDEPQLIYVLLELSPQIPTNRDNSPLLNLCLVLDVSTSMQGRYLDVMKYSAIKLVREMRDQDVLSIITFSDRANVLVPAGIIHDPKAIESKIQMLTSSGGTEIFQGLEKGFAELRHFRSEKRINHIILLTDGRTYGDEENCLLLAQQAAEQGVTISGLGIGGKWNDIFLDQLTAITGGNSLFVSKPTEILYFLSEKFKSLSHSFAQNVKYVYNLHKGVELKFAYRLQPDSAPLLTESELVLGSIQDKTSLKVLFEFLIRGLKETTDDKIISNGKILLNIPSNNQTREYHMVDFTRPTSIEYFTEYPHPIIFDAMSKLTMYRMQELARHEISEGSTDSAKKKLQMMASQLLSRGETELADVVLNEVKNIQQKESFTEAGEKRIKYGTRNLLLPEILEDQ